MRVLENFYCKRTHRYHEQGTELRETDLTEDELKQAQEKGLVEKTGPANGQGKAKPKTRTTSAAKKKPKPEEA
jgi:hypothetical protein